MSALTGGIRLPLPGPVISQPRDPSGILSTVLQSELKPLVLRLELLRCNVSLFTEWALKQECSFCWQSVWVSATRFATMESAMKTDVRQTTNAHPASPATQLVAPARQHQTAA